jgi:hypothetical protein
MTRLARPARPAAAALLATALISGCATEDSGSSGGAAPGAAAIPDSATVYVKTACSLTAGNTLVPLDPAKSPTASPGYPGLGRGGAIPAGFAPVSVIGCGMDVQDVPGDGTWQVATQTEADGDLDDLVAAYRMPAPTPPGNVCTTDMDLDPAIAFVDAGGTAIWPAPPRDAICHHISTRVTAAMRALHWPVTKSQRTSPAAAPTPPT